MNSCSSNLDRRFEIFPTQCCLLGPYTGDALGSLGEIQSLKEICRDYPDGVRELADGGTWNTIADAALRPINSGLSPILLTAT